MIWAINGFWGESSDWEFLQTPLAQNFRLKIQSVEPLSLQQNSTKILNEIQAQDPEPLLLAYSMGARLALSKILLSSANPFKAAILIAPHLGLPQIDSYKRVEDDEALAQEFLSTKQWPELRQSWESKKIFGGFSVPRLPPQDAKSMRHRLAQELRECGLVRQEPLYPRIHEIKIPILWAVGEKDHKFRAEMQKAQSQNPQIDTLILPGAHHRCHLEQKALFTYSIVQFLLRYFSAKRRVA